MCACVGVCVFVFLCTRVYVCICVCALFARPSNRPLFPLCKPMQIRGKPVPSVLPPKLESLLHGQDRRTDGSASTADQEGASNAPSEATPASIGSAAGATSTSTSTSTTATPANQGFPVVPEGVSVFIKVVLSRSSFFSPSKHSYPLSSPSPPLFF